MMRIVPLSCLLLSIAEAKINATTSATINGKTMVEAKANVTTSVKINATTGVEAKINATTSAKINATTGVQAKIDALKKPNPVEKVVELLEDLKGTIEQDGKDEQKAYDKYACWCEDTTAEKAAAIDSAKETIAESQSEKIRLGGTLAELGVTIKQLEKEMAENEAARKEATAIRTKERNSYIEKKSESEQCIQALHQAVGVLEGAGTKKTLFLGTLQQAQILSAAAGIRNVVLTRKAIADMVSDADLKLVRQFVEQPEEYEQRKPVMSGAEMGSQVDSTNPHGDYAPASTQIIGILKGMYDSFTGDLEKDNGEEAEKQKAYEELMKTQLEEYKSLVETLDMKTEDHAEDGKSKADHEQMLEDTKVQLELDEKFFLETKETCKQKATDWAVRTRMRTEELAGIEKAIEILTSDEAKEAFEAAHKNEKTEKLLFLQVSAHNSAEPLVHAAYERLKAYATKFHSLRLASLATQVQTSGHFDKIIVMIDKMIAELRKEEKEDIALKDKCQNQENANSNAKDDAKYWIEKIGKYIERKESEKEALEKKIDVVTKEIEDTKKSLDELKEDRNTETEDFKKNLKADQDAIAILGQAITAITKFYNNNKLPLDLIQQPEQAPASGAGSRSSQSKGIIAILGFIKEDLEKEIKVAREEEAAAQAEYERQRSDLTKTLRAQEKTKTTLEGDLADLVADIAEAEDNKDLKKKEKKAIEGEIDALKESCDWVADKFDTRREQRKTEIDGLIEAKSILAGAVPPEFLQNP